MECCFEPQLQHCPSVGLNCPWRNLHCAPFLQPVPSLKKRHGCVRPCPLPLLELDLPLLLLRSDLTLPASLASSSDW